MEPRGRVSELIDGNSSFNLRDALLGSLAIRITRLDAGTLSSLGRCHERRSRLQRRSSRPKDRHSSAITECVTLVCRSVV